MKQLFKKENKNKMKDSRIELQINLKWAARSTVYSKAQIQYRNGK